MAPHHDAMNAAQTLVIKVGSSLLIDAGALDRDWLNGLAEDIRHLRDNAKNVVIVSSGAVGLGAGTLGLARDQLTLEQSQAAAAAGQIALADGWQNALAPQGLVAAQILLTIEDTEQRRRYLNARQTIDTLLGLGAVPVINENDSVATQELRYGDNDRLAARVAGMISADCLVLLSDVDGLYTAKPDTDATATHIELIDQVDDTLMAMAGDSGSAYGSGGMTTKLEAAKIAMQAGCHMLLADGRGRRPLANLAQNGRCSVFRASTNPHNARKQWIGGSLQAQGQIHIDAGAETALAAGKSLLPVGVVAIDGAFERGDCVSVVNAAGHEIGRGLSAYSSTDAALICGQPSQAIASLLGYKGRAEMIHRDDLVLGTGQ